MQYYSFLLKGKSIFVTFNAYRKQIKHERSEFGYIQRDYNDLYHLFLSFDMVGRCQGRHIWRKLDYRDIFCNGNRVLHSRSFILYLMCSLPLRWNIDYLIIFGLFRLTWSYLFVFPFYAGWFAGAIYLLSFLVAFWYCCCRSKLIILSCFKL